MSYISIIDIGVNNLRSVVGVFNHLNFKTIITKDTNKIMNSAALILPGVGSFPSGMKNLKKNGLDLIIKKFFKQGKPILAICLGFQMLFSSSEEFGDTKGLNILGGKVKSLKSLKTSKISPNLGWAKLNYKKNKNNHLFNQFDDKLPVYFIHSYYAEVKNKKFITSNISLGGVKVTTSIQYKNLYGVQFHPEKSGKDGIKIIKNFLRQIKT
jgi:glutamine amidotransferase